MLKELKNHKKVFVAMSGGVDSSVAAYLLKNKGYEIAGVFMRCYNLDGCSEKDSEDARRVAEKLAIPFYVWDFEEEYKKKVVGYMIDGYSRGLTPNPDVMCNREIKFGLFLKKALEMGADFVATGHYTIVKRKPMFSRGISATNHRRRRGPAGSGGQAWCERSERAKERRSERARWASKRREKISDSVCCQLFEAVDKNKDQSYFLWTLTQEQLKHCLFPVGNYLKSEVREIARKAGLPTAEKKDSQGICFLGKVTIQDFLRRHIPENRGTVLAVNGKKLGEHGGACYYTIGQRHIGISNRRPVYVVRKDMETNTVVVAESGDNPELYKKEINLGDINFIGEQPEAGGCLRVFARVRYRQPKTAATFTDGKLTFDSPQKFIAPGQSAVFYSAEGKLLGGGVIV